MMRYVANGFKTLAEAEACKSGIQFVCDSSIEAVDIEYNDQEEEWEVIVSDNDYNRTEFTQTRKLR